MTRLPSSGPGRMMASGMVASGKEVREPLRDHEHRGVAVAGRDGRHHAGVRDPEPVHPADLEERVDDGHVVEANAARAGHMEVTDGAGPGERPQLPGAGHLWAWA